MIRVSRIRVHNMLDFLVIRVLQTQIKALYDALTALEQRIAILEVKAENPLYLIIHEKDNE